MHTHAKPTTNPNNYFKSHFKLPTWIVTEIKEQLIPTSQQQQHNNTKKITHQSLRGEETTRNQVENSFKSQATMED